MHFWELCLMKITLFLKKKMRKSPLFHCVFCDFSRFLRNRKKFTSTKFLGIFKGGPVNIWGDHGQIMGDHGQIMGRSWAMLGFGGFSQLTAGFWWVFAAYGWVFRLACWVFLPYGWVFRLRNDKVNSLLLFGNRTKVTENIPLFGGPYRNSDRQFFYSPIRRA